MSFEATHTDSRKAADPARISNLDGLRGLVASLVVVSHLDLFLAPRFTPEWLTVGLGGESVAIFFSLGGFLMAFLYGGRRFDAPDYIVHRFARIFPVYMVSVILVTLLSALPGLGYIEPIEGPVQIARHLLMIGSTGVFWSIPPEIQFYFYFLLIWLWLENPERYRWVPLLTAALVVLCTLSGLAGPGILLTSKLPYFLFGVIAGRVFARARQRFDHPATGFVGLALLTFYLLYRTIVSPQAEFWSLTTAFGAAVVVFLAAFGNSVSDAVLGSGIFTLAGKISFSLYLLHVPVMFLVMRLIGSRLPNLLAVLIAVAAAYASAFASYHLIEKLCRRKLIGLWRHYRHAPFLVQPR
ncbi:acyltransferase family protein [Roseibium aggregatum]|uniref:Acyltransferase n=1 Tax=Roseibium aggregatum TaxID=187304 RepID=A0A926S831_9HYPH|nr:acyltransferase [Roseibium aggregatum]MBD1548227.1 acyltransferase [Roseibium aggregatum]